MKIQFVSRAEIKNLIENNVIDKENTAVISISDTWEEAGEIGDMLYKYFPDELDYHCEAFADDEESMFNRQSEDILWFIKHHGTKKDYLVHCFAGISRSGAIAKFINEYYDAGNWYLEDYQGYNRHVFNMLHKAAGTSLISYYEELEKQDRKFNWED